MKNYSQLIKHKGNSPLFDILELSILGTLKGCPVHIHAEGLRGTGKTTIIRAYKEIMPKITRIKGCLYNCDPENPICPEHRNLSYQEIKEIGTELINMPFLEISPSAKKGTVVGSIDLQKLTSNEKPEVALKLGTIPMANRGVIFVDEINRIADISPEIVDILLDVMGTKPGRIQIEETGLPNVELPIQVSVWAASNPDEEPGPLEDIRRQLSDRFDFTVYVERPTEPSIIQSILNNNSQPDDESLAIKKREHIQESCAYIDTYVPDEKIQNLLASLYIDFNIESLRGVEAILLGLKLRCALQKRMPNINDVLFLTKWAMKHRTDNKNLMEILNFLEESVHNLNKGIQTDNIQEKVSKKESESASDEHSKLNKPIEKQREKCFPAPHLKNILSRFLKAKKSETPKGGSNAVDPKKMKIKAPPCKALSLNELLPEEYVKTEEDLK